ncbi:telomere repeat binding factor-domain-containing protein [Hypoxylon sp. NC1633]|nr:telomere repeat binding factor-domain-containing protein [Hypoxylon sp. NC1633]
MADIAEVIAAAMAAAVPPTSPRIKAEPPASDPMTLDPKPERPQSPLKRPRTPDQDDDPSRDEKRPKMESEGGFAMDDFALLVQQAEASVLQQFQHDSSRADGLSAEHVHDLNHDRPRDVSQDTSTLEPTSEPQATGPVENVEPRPESLWSNPRNFTRRKHIIPALGSLAVDIIIAWSEQSLEDTIATLSGDSDSDIAREYVTLKAAFDAQRKLLSEAHPLLYREQINVASQAREVVRIINLATACASVFGTNELGLEEINDHFLRIFVPEGQELPRDTAELYLGFKTQIFLAILECEQEKARDQVLDDLFVTGLENALQEHHPSLPLTLAEHEFVANARVRKAMLLNESADIDSMRALSKQFTYEAFLDSLSIYLNDHIESIRVQGTSKVETTTSVEDAAQDEHVAQGIDGTFDINAMIAEASRAAQSALAPNGQAAQEADELSAFLAENVSKAVEQAKESATNTELPSAIASAAESASRATMLALQSIQQNQYQPTALPQSTSQSQSVSNSNHNNNQSQPIQQTQQAQPQQQYYQYQQPPATNGAPQYHSSGDHLPPNQSDSTPALYERARQAAAARSSTHARREGSHSTRRPWSPEEEKALMMGLDLVKGPHWSQILSLFGANGSISTILADRTQVQLKDKARNLKLFFLKTNSEMPYYLQCVTGELKTRAPTQAARKEAEEKARLDSEEQQAHVNGILTLAGGLQNNASSRESPATTMPRSMTPNQPLSHPNSQPGTPRVPQQPMQPLAPAPAPVPVSLPRPVMPAPQPVSLPSFTSSAHQHTQPLAVSQAEGQMTPAIATTAPPDTAPVATPTITAESAPTAVIATAPPVESNESEPFRLTNVDAAVLRLRLALERERNADLTATPEEDTFSATASATPTATSTQ